MANNPYSSVSLGQTQKTQPLDKLGLGANIVLGVVVVILVFLLIRAFWLWYWKVNEIVNLLQDIKNNTSKPTQPVVNKST